jgi:hypothetical protein
MPSVSTVTYGASAVAGAGSGSSGQLGVVSSSGNQLAVAATDQYVYQSFVLEGLASGVEVPLAGLDSVSFVIIKASAAVTLQVDDSGTGEVRGVNPVYLERFPTNATALYLSNDGADDVNVDVMMVGPIPVIP